MIITAPADVRDSDEPIIIPVDVDEGCVGCGLCCDRAPCLVSCVRHGIPETWNGCASLLWDGVRHWCGLYRWRKLSRICGWIEGPLRCHHPMNAWKRETLTNRTIRSEHRSENFQEKMLEQLFAMSREGAPPYMASFLESYQRQFLSKVKRKQ